MRDCQYQEDAPIFLREVARLCRRYGLRISGNSLTVKPIQSANDVKEVAVHWDERMVSYYTESVEGKND